MVSRKDAPTQEVTLPDELPDEVVAGFDSFDSAIAHFREGFGVVNIGDVAGDGFSLQKDKTLLENVPFLIIDWKEISGISSDTGRPYATIRIITADGRKYRISDGSTGIYSQLLRMADKGVRHGIAVPKGLFKSEYWVDADGMPLKDPDTYKGEKRKAYTFYLNESS